MTKNTKTVNRERTMIPLSVPLINGNEWKYVKECLDTGWVSSVGAYVEKFESMMAQEAGTRFAVATVNGTAALHLSLIACGVKPDDAVIVPSLTFIAPVNVVRYCHAHPVFMDCDPRTLGLDVGKLKDFLKKECRVTKDGCVHKKSKRAIKAIVPVHIFGHPVDMDALLEVSRAFNIPVVEDATESLGSRYKGKPTGSFGFTGCFSFNGNKIITTGGGGMITTNDEKLAKKLKHLSTQAKIDPVEYDHDEVGFNYRLTNVQAAIGVAQLERLPEYLVIKRKNAQIYRQLLGKIKGVEFFGEEPWAKSNFWFYTLKVAKEHKNPLLQKFLADKVQARPLWKLNHQLPMYKKDYAYRIEHAAEAYATCLNVPCSVNLTEGDIAEVVSVVKEYFGS